MKVLCRCAIVVLMIVSAGALSGKEEKMHTPETVRLLTIGNSFSRNATAYLADIAASRGRALVLTRADIGGCSLQRHWANVESGQPAYSKNRSLKKILQSQTYDVVTIQQQSYSSIDPESFHPYADHLIQFIREHAPTAEIVVHQTWAYREDHHFFRREERDLSQDKMFVALKTCYDNLAKRYGFRILPSGEAFRRCRRTQPVKFTFPDPEFDYDNAVYPQTPNQEGSLINGWFWKQKENGKRRLGHDPKHANARGQYLLGCVWYEVLFDDNAEKVDFTPHGIIPEDAAFLRTTAHETVVDHVREQPN